MPKFPNETKNEIPLLPDAEIAAFCDELTDDERLALAMTIDEEVQGMGYSATRAGSEVWEYARACAVTEITAREMSIGAMASEHLPNLGHTDSDEPEVKQAVKTHKKRIEAFAQYLLEETQERKGEN